MIELSCMNLHKYKGDQCDTLVVTCIDFRFRKEISDVLQRAGFYDFDLVAIPGASKSISAEAGQEVFFQALEVAIRCHGVRRVIIIDHVDCAAYGGSREHSDKQAEESFHFERLQEAGDVIRAAHPELEIQLLYMDWDRVKPVASLEEARR